MKAKRLWVVAVLFVCCVVFLPMTILGVSESEKLQLLAFGRSTLEGVRSVSIGVECPSVPTWSLKEVLQTQVELELRKAGIKIVEDANDVYGPALNMQISVLRVEEHSLYTGSVNVYLSQLVVLDRDPTITTFVRTWPVRPVVHNFWSKSSNPVEVIKNAVTERTREFCNDYLAANPKEPEKKGKSLIPDELADRYTWMLCRNPDCRNSWEMNLKEYYEMVEEFRIEKPGLMENPAATCPKCEEPSGYIAVKCEKCELVFEKGTVPRDFEDRCPKCNFSKIEQRRAERAAKQ